MGRSSKSSTSTQQSDERVAATDTALAIGGGATANINVVEPIALQDLIAVGGGVIEDAFNFAKTQQAANNATLQRGFDLVTKETDTEAQSLSKQVLKIGAVVLVVAVLAQGLK